MHMAEEKLEQIEITQAEAEQQVITAEDLEDKPQARNIIVDAGGVSVETGDVKKKKKKKKGQKILAKGQAHILATYNNTLITITDMQGNVVVWASSGHVGFKGPKKATPYASSMVVRNLAEKLKDSGLKELEIYVKGVGQGREAAIRALNAQGYRITMIKDTTPIPHNGPRAKKPRRV